MSPGARGLALAAAILVLAGGAARPQSAPPGVAEPVRSTTPAATVPSEPASPAAAGPTAVTTAGPRPRRAPAPKAGRATLALFDGAFVRSIEKAGLTATDLLDRRLLAEYGAMFVCGDRGVVLPSKLMHADPEELAGFWKKISPVKLTVRGTTVELQPPVARALEKALAEAKRRGLSITPRGGPSAARRTYQDALTFWTRRVENGLAHWSRSGRLPARQAASIRRMAVREQAAAVLGLEACGMWFSTRLDRSILRSVAPPGASQHHTMLALDVTEHDSATVRAILEKHGFFQTVRDDLPHFTYLGLAVDDLEAAGLTSVEVDRRTYWVPAGR